MPLTVSYGGGTLSALADRLDREIKLTEADFLYAGNRQKARILNRTQAGVDINSTAFAPYSTKGPYYWYPGRGQGDKRRRSAAGRAAKKVGGTRTRLGVKFASYADFKSQLGRGTVDLTGPSAPHMLQAIVVQGRPDGFLVGIYGNEADRAEGHNIGFGRLPKREFFGFGPQDEAAILVDLEKFIAMRLDKIL